MSRRGRGWPRGRWRALLKAAAGLLACASAARAGPPYLSDDPEPTDYRHWEIYNFAIGSTSASGLGGAAGFDINYGGARDLQLTAVLPVGFDDRGGRGIGALRGGFGDIELAAKYRFLHQGEGGSGVDVSLFPRLFTPTGGSRYGSDHFGLLIPVWAQKDVGPWSLFGGGGYQIAPGAGNRSFWQGGGALARTFGKRLQLGGEVFAQGDDAPGEGGFTAVDLGLTYKLVEHWSLLASGGPSWNHAAPDGAIFYVSLKADY